MDLTVLKTAPVLVLGSGRCGTSTVARLLHERCGVLMGNRFRDRDKDNPNGFYEDLQFKNLNQDLLSGTISLPQWMDLTGRLVRERTLYGQRWGIKDPRLCYLAGLLFGLLGEPPKVIVCDRNSQEVAASCSRCYGWPSDQSLAEVVRRKLSLARMIEGRPHLYLSFDMHRVDDELAEKIDSYLEWP